MNIIEIKENNMKKEIFLSEFATRSTEAIRIKEEQEDIRPAFFHDIDRMIHSMSYTRYLDKTQVYSFRENDHISKRMVHVQLVSKIARTIGRAINLNEDLIEAISLGHDIGHTPLGHEGEKCLNEISKRELNRPFLHNIQSVRVYLSLDNHGNGSNLTVQTLDGIMCHNGEMLNNVYEKEEKTKEEFLREYENCRKSEEFAKKIKPMTLEGCVVRISDIIAYIGRDIDDAVRLGLLKREEIPKEITNVLGDNNKDIVNTIILDIIENSYNMPYIKLSEEVYEALEALKEFNYKKIYYFSNTKEQLEYYKNGFELLYKYYLEDLNKENKDSIIYTIYLNDMSTYYYEGTEKEQIVIDFIAGMTDDFYLNEVKRVMKLCQ